MLAPLHEDLHDIGNEPRSISDSSCKCDSSLWDQSRDTRESDVGAAECTGTGCIHIVDEDSLQVVTVHRSGQYGLTMRLLGLYVAHLWESAPVQALGSESRKRLRSR